MEGDDDFSPDDPPSGHSWEGRERRDGAEEWKDTLSGDWKSN